METRIELSKKKLILALIASIIFVTVGIIFVINPTKFTSFLFRSPTLIFLAGLASIIFFGGLWLYLIKKMFDKKAGLIVSDEGITDNSSAISVGFVSWEDITEITVQEVMSNKFIILITNQPEKYINKEKNRLKRHSLNYNYNNFGSPIAITSNSLQISFKNLENLLREEFEKIKKNGR